MRFGVENVQLQGTWRGTPFEARLAMFHGPMVDLLSATARELAPGHDVTFVVDADVASWFAGDVLDGAPAMNGQIRIDGMTNPTVAGTLTDRLRASFSLE